MFYICASHLLSGHVRRPRNTERELLRWNSSDKRMWSKCMEQTHETNVICCLKHKQDGWHYSGTLK